MKFTLLMIPNTLFSQFNHDTLLSIPITPHAYVIQHP